MSTENTEPEQSEAQRGEAPNERLVMLPNEDAITPIANALYSTGNFKMDDCQNMAEGILESILDYGYAVAKAT